MIRIITLAVTLADGRLATITTYPDREEIHISGIRPEVIVTTYMHMRALRDMLNILDLDE